MVACLFVCLRFGKKYLTCSILGLLALRGVSLSSSVSMFSRNLWEIMQVLRTSAILPPKQERDIYQLALRESRRSALRRQKAETV